MFILYVLKAEWKELSEISWCSSHWNWISVKLSII